MRDLSRAWREFGYETMVDLLPPLHARRRRHGAMLKSETKR